MKSNLKRAIKAINNVTGIALDSAKAIISVIGTDITRFPTDARYLSPGQISRVQVNANPAPKKEISFCVSTLIVCHIQKQEQRQAVYLSLKTF